MKKSKVLGILSSVICAGMMLSTSVAAVPFDATEVNYDKEINPVAELDPSMPQTRGLFSKYNIYCDKWWIMNSRNVGVGAEGWTDVDYKSDGSNKYHYSNIQVYSGSGPDSTTYESGRKWGYGRVQVSTGDLGKGAMYSHRIYYGWDD